MTPQLDDKVRRRLDHYALVLDQQYPTRPLDTKRARAGTFLACEEEFIIPPPASVSVDTEIRRVVLYQADGTALTRQIGYKR